MSSESIDSASSTKSLPEGLKQRIYELAGPGPDTASAGVRLQSDKQCGEPAMQHVTWDLNLKETPDAASGHLSLTGLPRAFGHYELLEEMGRGGMGVVFKAKDLRLNRIVAVKQILDGALADERAVRLFQTEAKIAASLQHLGIVPIFDVGEVGGQHFFTMPLIDGDPLSKVIKNGPMDPREAAIIVLRLAEAMQHAHEHGVLHRDLTPANILMPAGLHPQIMDFGLARLLSEEHRATTIGSLMGTPAYMAPEQVRCQHDQLGPQTDVYAMGVILYEMLSSRPPFQAADQWHLLSRIVKDDAVSLMRLDPSLPRNLAAICEKCLAKSIGHRYSTAQELAEDLLNFLDGRTIQARPITPFERFWRLCVRNKAQSLAACATVLLFVSLMVFLFSLNSSQQRALQSAKELQLMQESVDTERFFSTLSEVREFSNDTQPEARSRNLELLSSVAALATTDEQKLALRSLTMQVRARPGLTRVAALADGFPAARVQFSPDGQWLAIGELYCGGPPRVLLVNVNTRQIRYTLIATCEDDEGRVPPSAEDDPTNGVRAIQFEPNGTRLMVGLRDGSVHLWDSYKDGPENHVWFTAHNGWVNGTVFTHREDVVVSWSSGTDDFIRKWKQQTDGTWQKTSEIRSIQQGGEPGIAVGDLGQTLLVVEGQDLLTTQIDDFSELHKMKFAGLPESDMHFGGSGLSMTVSPDGRFFAAQRLAEISVVCAESGHRLVDLTDPRLVDAAHQSEVYSLAFHPTEPWLISTGADQRVKLWDFASGELLLSFVVPGDGLVTATFSPDGQHVAVTGLEQTLLMRLEGLDSAYTLGLQREVIHAVTNDRSRSRIATLSETIVPEFVRLGDVVVTDIATRRNVLSQNVTGLLDVSPVYPPAICLSPNGHWLAYHGRSKQCLLQDLHSGESQVFIDTENPRTITMDNDTIWLVYEETDPSKAVGPGPQIASIGTSNFQKQVHIANSRAELESRVSYVSQLLLTQHGLLIASRDGSVLLVDRTDGHEIRSWRGRTVAARSLAVSRDEGLLAVGYQDGTIDVHRLPSCERLATWTAHRDTIEALSFSADGSRLLSGASTGTLRLWQKLRDSDGYTLQMNIAENRRPVTWTMLDAEGETAYVHFLKETAIRCYELNEAISETETQPKNRQASVDRSSRDSDATPGERH